MPSRYQYATTLATRAFVEKVERFARRTFLYRDEIALLIDLAETTSQRQAFDDLIFRSKFVSNARAVLERAGSSSMETSNLETEFRESLKTTCTLFKAIIERAPEPVGSVFSESFLGFSHESLARRFDLLYELSWVKNYLLDNNDRYSETSP